MLNCELLNSFQQKEVLINNLFHILESKDCATFLLAPPKPNF
jgi:hypothetical protein